MQGVRQLAPSEVRASARGGSDSIVSETFGPLVRLLGIQLVGAQEPQPAASKALAIAHTRTNGIIALRPRGPPGADHTGRAGAMQPKPGSRNLAGVAETRANLLHSQSL